MRCEMINYKNIGFNINSKIKLLNFLHDKWINDK